MIFPRVAWDEKGRQIQIITAMNVLRGKEHSSNILNIIREIMTDAICRGHFHAPSAFVGRL